MIIRSTSNRSMIARQRDPAARLPPPEEVQLGRQVVKQIFLAGTAVALLLGVAGSSEAAGKKTLAFVVNGASDFWKAAEAGVKKAQGELPNYELVFKYPEQSSAAIQTRLMDDLVAEDCS